MTVEGGVRNDRKARPRRPPSEEEAPRLPTPDPRRETVIPSPDQIGGLSEPDVEDRRRRFGLNRLSLPPRPPWWLGWLRQFDDPIIRLLLGTAVIMALIGVSEGSMIETAVICLIVTLATLIGFISEERADREFDLLAVARECVPVRVVRNGALASVSRSEIVVDDIVWLEAGDEVPADGLLIRGQAVEIDESRLTGDLRPVLKWPSDRLSVAVIGVGTASPDRLLRGSAVRQGRGLMRVTAVGDATELGRAGGQASAEREEPSPLRKQLDGLGRAIAFFGVTAAAVIFAVLVAGRVTTGSIVIPPGQAWAHLCLGAGVAAALLPFWLPTALDILGLAGFEITGRDLFAGAGLPPWLLGIRWGCTVAGIGLLFGWAAGILPFSLAAWGSRPLEAALLQDLLQAIALIVVAVPDGLSMSITLCLAWGMRRLLAGRTIVRRLHACETIGAVTVICTGDTGAMMEPRLSVGSYLEGTISRDAALAPHPLLAEAISVNATAHLARRCDDPPVTIGDPLEGALLFWLRDRGISYLGHRTGFELVRQWHAGPDTWFMATLGRPGGDENPADGRRLHVKGPAELLLKRCRRILEGGVTRPLAADAAARRDLETSLRSLAADGRVIGFAMRATTGSEPADPLEDLVWLGAVLISGTISPETAAALDQCLRAGIRVTLVTSETPEHAEKIARKAGLVGGPAAPCQVMTGEALRRVIGASGTHLAELPRVLARAGTGDRSSLVDLLRRRGEVVAAIGEREADASVLRQADIGLVMGNGASDRVRASGDLVLLDEGLHALLAAVRWGRSLFLNIQRFLVFQLSVNVMALGINLIGPFIGVRLPLTILQMLWVNIIMDIFAALALATEPPHPGILDDPPRSSRAFIVTRPMLKAILTTSAVCMSAFVVILRSWQRPDGEIDARHLTWFFCLFVFVQLWNLVNARGFGARRPPWLGIGENPWFGAMFLVTLVAQVLIVQMGGEVFRTIPLSLGEWALLLAATSPLLLLGRVLGAPGARRSSG